MDRNNFYDTNTSAIPSISLTFEQSKQGFSKTISEVVSDKEPNFEFWITIVWRDETQKSKNDDDEVVQKMIMFEHMKNTRTENLSLNERKNLTIERTENLLQNLMWESVEQLKQK